MVDDGRSSLQKAVAKSNNSSSLSIANGYGRRGSGKKTETSFEVGSSAVHPTVAAAGNKSGSLSMTSDSSHTLGEGKGTKVLETRNRRSSKKSSQHFTIISAHDELQNNNFDSTMDVDHHHEISNSNMDVEDTFAISPGNRRSPITSTTKTQTFLQIGGLQEERKTEFTMAAPLSCDDDNDDRQIEQMEGVIDQGTKMPLVVLDGANVAYAYASVMAGNNNSSLEAASSASSKSKLEPDARGIQIATDFFLEAGVRALVVLPQYWFRGNRSANTATTLISQSEILSGLKAKGLVVASPPTDDDDAYALTISRREEIRSCKPPRNGEGPGFVLSNDMFRDAQERDSPNGTLKEWLTKGRNADIGPGRISYTFGDMGSMNDRGERVLDFVPNPRHPLVVWMENKTNEIDRSYIS